jgi:hypothetical protein
MDDALDQAASARPENAQPSVFDSPSGAPTLPTPTTTPVVPVLPGSGPATPASASTPPGIDAKDGVRSKKRTPENPAHGMLPTSSEASRAATHRLRTKARRKRTRDKILAKFLALIVIGAVGGAGYLIYQAYQNDQDGEAAAREARAELQVDRNGGSLGPLGEQVATAEALEDLNSGATASAGGLLDAVDEARDVVRQTSGDVSAVNTASLDQVLPDGLLDVATRIVDSDGYARFTVNAQTYSTSYPAEYIDWIDLMQSQEQISTGLAVFDVLPDIFRGQIAIAIRSDGSEVLHAIVRGRTPDVALTFG